MKKIAQVFLTAITFATLGFGQALAQEPQNYVAAGFNLGSGMTAWTSVAGANGFGQMNFGSSWAPPLVNMSASNQYGSVEVFARPWANGFVSSQAGGSANVSATFMGNGEAFTQLTKEGMSTYTSINKSMNMTASSTGNGSAAVFGGFDVGVRTNGFTPVPPAPTFNAPPSSPGKG
jgi:hypothetical protein